MPYLNNIGAPVVEQGTKIDSDGIMSRSRGRGLWPVCHQSSDDLAKMVAQLQREVVASRRQGGSATLSVPAPLLRWKERDVCFWEGRYQMLAQA